MTNALLDGIRVIDLSRVLAGPLAAMLLGDLGADVVKVERPGIGDETRSWGPPFAGDPEQGMSAYYLSVNRNKRGMTLDLADPDGQAVAAELLGEADVVIDNFKPGTLAQWGFGDDWFVRHRPSAVRCTISGYGSSSQQAGKPGYDFVLQAESGLMSITGEPDGRPLRHGVAIADVATGLYATTGILAALYARERTGAGRHVAVNLHDAAVATLINVASNVLVGGGDAGRFANTHPNLVPYAAYPTSDGELVIAVGNDRQFVQLCTVLDRREWASDPRFRTNPARLANRAVLDAAIAGRVAGQSRHHWTALLDEAGVPCGAINTVREALSSAGSMVHRIESSVAGIVQVLGPVIGFDGEVGAVRLPPPGLGEHTDEVLTDLGYTHDRISALRSGGIV